MTVYCAALKAAYAQILDKTNSVLRIHNKSEEMGPMRAAHVYTECGYCVSHQWQNIYMHVMYLRKCVVKR